MRTDAYGTHLLRHTPFGPHLAHPMRTFLLRSRLTETHRVWHDWHDRVWQDWLFHVLLVAQLRSIRLSLQSSWVPTSKLAGISCNRHTSPKELTFAWTRKTPLLATSCLRPRCCDPHQCPTRASDRHCSEAWVDGHGEGKRRKEFGGHPKLRKNVQQQKDFWRL